MFKVFYILILWFYCFTCFRCAPIRPVGTGRWRLGILRGCTYLGIFSRLFGSSHKGSLTTTHQQKLGKGCHQSKMDYSYLKAARKIVCIGRNYAAHVKELNNPFPKQPFFFLKPSSSIVTPHDKQAPQETRQHAECSYRGLNADGTNPGAIMIPEGVKVHHEVELALIIGDYISNASPSAFGPKELRRAISGIALSLDLTARNVQDEAKRKGLPWSIGKGFDTFLPMSKFIPEARLGKNLDLQDAFRLKCTVNSITRQDGTTGLMLTPLHTIVQHISTMMSLEPGDIILTGTPAGVGELKPGDSVYSELFFNGEPLVNMQFDCVKRPGPYVYRET
ncbi:Fmp41p [Lachancea thermotolerans CBS 6340]|uniref:KLTH0B06754p n=1 Tax=Lachancea thermotolerans (strain ATCC 56472 / CBS 6340 / NRRL Y-8284) TaxID=559295 RepID=C5DCY2_LACTC|nr:KLTH0B06754p [Lachancea thermotolerans CBS 6340]CAR21643.1 KLTH0B06754p [Lachancea thermotolerans CBS 6340]